MKDDDIKDRVEMIVRPDFIVGQYFFIFMPWTATRRRNAFFVDFSTEKHAWKAILSELKQTLAGTAWYHPEGRHHVVDRGKFTIRSRPEHPYHIAYKRESYGFSVGLNKAEIAFVIEAMEFYLRRDKNGNAEKIIFPHLHQ